VTTLDSRLLLGAYAVGVFPMADGRDAADVYWVEPRRRAVLPLDGFHLSRSLRKLIAADRYRVTADRAFADVIRLCAESVEDRPDTWINDGIEAAFIDLHGRGLAHSVEVWDGERLAGGLYGLALGRAFFGESMVSRAPSASKVALAWLVARLRLGGFELLDCQFQTDHLRTMGAVEVPRADYMARLGSALEGTAFGGAAAAGGASASGDFGALDRLADGDVSPFSGTVSGPLSGKVVAQLLVHTS